MSRGDEHAMSYLGFAAMLGNLASDVRTRRIDRGLSLRAAATAIGIPFQTLYRFEQGGNLEYRALCRVARWMCDSS